jgi:hypothetical protein
MRHGVGVVAPTGSSSQPTHSQRSFVPSLVFSRPKCTHFIGVGPLRVYKETHGPARACRGKLSTRRHGHPAVVGRSQPRRHLHSVPIRATHEAPHRVCCPSMYTSSPLNAAEASFGRFGEEELGRALPRDPSIPHLIRLQKSTPHGPETQQTPLGLGLLVPGGSGAGAAGVGGAARRRYLSVLESSQSSALSSQH